MCHLNNLVIYKTSDYMRVQLLLVKPAAEQTGYPSVTAAHKYKSTNHRLCLTYRREEFS